MSLLEIRDLDAGYGEVQILWGAGLAAEEGQLTCLVGGNGAGKTTLLRAVMGLLRPRRGVVRFAGEDVTRLRAHAKAERGLVLVPEGRQLFTDMTVEENIEMGATPRRARAQLARNRARAFEMFPRLAERARQKAGTLSGGEQQMLALARGIVAEPRILMIDELSLGLAPIIADQLFGALRGLREAGTTILLVEQNVPMALAVADRAYVLAGGRIELGGPAAEIARDERVRTAYLGL